MAIGRATVSFCDGATRNIDLEQIADFVTETRNPLNVKSVEQVIVRYPSAWLRDRAKLVDTAISDGAALRKRGEEDAAARFQTLTSSLASAEVLQKQVTEALQ